MFVDAGRRLDCARASEPLLHHLRRAPRRGAPRARARRCWRFFATRARHGGSLVINGDLFDFWFEWQNGDAAARHFASLAALADLRDAGMPVLMIAGNHDCWGGDVLARRVGVDYPLGPWEGDVGGWRAHIEHGDGLAPREDRGYRALRRVLRNPLGDSRVSLAASGPRDARSRTGSSHASRTYARARRRARVCATSATRSLDARPRPRARGVRSFARRDARATARGAACTRNPGSWLDAPTFLRMTTGAHRAARSGTAQPRVTDLDAIDRRAEKALAKLGTAAGRPTRRSDATDRRPRRRARFAFGERRRAVSAAVSSALSMSRTSRPRTSREQRLEQRIVRAAEHERVDRRRRRAARGTRAAMRRVASWSSQPSSTSGTNSGHARATTCASGSSARMARSYAPDLMVPAVPITPMSPRRGRRDRGARAGLDDADHRHRQLVAQRGERVRGGGVARDDDRLHALLAQEVGDLAAVAPHRLRALRAVRHARRVAEVDDALVRQLAHDSRARRSGRRCRSRRRRSGTPRRGPSPGHGQRDRRRRGGPGGSSSCAGTSQRFAETNASAPAKR